MQRVAFLPRALVVKATAGYLRCYRTARPAYPTTCP